MALFASLSTLLGSLDHYILSTHPEEMASRAAMEFRSLLVPKWEAANGRPYDRRQFVFETRLTQRALKGRISNEDAELLIQKSRHQLALKRKLTTEPFTAPATPSEAPLADAVTPPTPAL